MVLREFSCRTRCRRMRWRVSRPYGKCATNVNRYVPGTEATDANSDARPE